MNAITIWAFQDEIQKIAAINPALLGSAIGAFGGAGAGAAVGGKGHRLSGALIGGAGGAVLGAGAGHVLGGGVGTAKVVRKAAVTPATQVAQAAPAAAIPASVPKSMTGPAITVSPRPGSLMADFNKTIEQAQESFNKWRAAPKSEFQRQAIRRTLPKSEAAASRAKKLEEAYKMEHYNLPYKVTAPKRYAESEARAKRLKALWERASSTGVPYGHVPSTFRSTV